MSLATEMELLWNQVSNEFRDKDIIRDIFKFGDMAEGLAESLRSLIREIRASATGLFKEDEEIELGASLLKLKAFSDGLEGFISGMDGYVRWIEREEGKTALRMVPVYPGEFVAHRIIPEFGSVVLTSATLSVSGDFHFISRASRAYGSCNDNPTVPF